MVSGEEKLDFDEYMLNLKLRLIQMEQERAFRFQATKRELAEKHLLKRLRFVGYTDEEIRSLEHSLSSRFPEAFRAYLRVFGHERGQLFVGSEASPHKFLEYREWALELLDECNVDRSVLPDKHIIFLFHQGYTFAFLTPGNVEDPHVWFYTECNANPVKSELTFSEFVEREITGMESIHQSLMASGGYLLKVTADGVQQTFPAHSDKRKPLSGNDEIVPDYSTPFFRNMIRWQNFSFTEIFHRWFMLFQYRLQTWLNKVK